MPEAAQKPEAEKPEVAEAKAASTAIKSVTCKSDLRVVTKDLVVFQLQAGKTRKLPEPLAFAAQAAAAEAKVTVEIK